jgi:hypothetical protein
LIPWLEESVMVTPEVVGCFGAAGLFVSRQEYGDSRPEDASRILLGLVTRFATWDRPGPLARNSWTSH